MNNLTKIKHFDRKIVYDNSFVSASPLLFFRKKYEFSKSKEIVIKEIKQDIDSCGEDSQEIDRLVKDFYDWEVIFADNSFGEKFSEDEEKLNLLITCGNSVRELIFFERQLLTFQKLIENFEIENKEECEQFIGEIEEIITGDYKTLKFKKNNITYKEKIIDNIERLKSMIIENENQDRDSIDTTITLLGLSENSIPATNSSTPNLESEESSFFKKNQNNQLFNTISNSFQSLFNENKNSFSSALPKIIKQKSYGAIRSVFASKPRTEQNSDQDPILLGQDTIANLLIPNSSVAGNINQERTQWWENIVSNQPPIKSIEEENTRNQQPFFSDQEDWNNESRGTA